MLDVEAEVNKHKTCRDRAELEKRIQEYKNLALQHATNFTLAGEYNMVAQKLRAICDRLPAPRLRNVSGQMSGPIKTATITNEEDARINAAWQQRTKK